MNEEGIDWGVAVVGGNVLNLYHVLHWRNGRERFGSMHLAVERRLCKDFVWGGYNTLSAIPSTFT